MMTIYYIECGGFEENGWPAIEMEELGIGYKTFEAAYEAAKKVAAEASDEFTGAPLFRDITEHRDAACICFVDDWGEVGCFNIRTLRIPD